MHCPIGSSRGDGRLSARGRYEPADHAVRLDVLDASEDPKVFTGIHVHFLFTGVNLSAKHIERAIQLSAEKYCSASIMLGKTARITHTFEIRES